MFVETCNRESKIELRELYHILRGKVGAEEKLRLNELIQY